MSLRAYHPTQIIHVNPISDALKAHKRPGDWVRHENSNGFGMVIASTPDECTVLWSVEPVSPRYNPLAMQEDIWIPIRKSDAVLGAE